MKLSEDGEYYIVEGLYIFADDKDVVIPESYKEKPVRKIGDNSLSSYDSLISVTIPNSVTSIGEFAFSDCDNLTSITIPDSVRSIGQHAFDFCGSLNSVTIGNGVVSIGDGAFWMCDSLTNIKFNGTKAQWIAIVKYKDFADDVPATEVICTDGTVSI